MNLIEIHFDGGVRPTNPGRKYGSYEVLLDHRTVFKASRIELGWGTNNEAEFDILIEALKRTVEELNRGGFPAGQYSAACFTDSMVVVNRLKNRNAGGKSEPARRMANLTLRCLAILDGFNNWTIDWNRRDANVKRFGH